MTEFELEDEIIFILFKEVFCDIDGNPFIDLSSKEISEKNLLPICGEVFKNGTRTKINNEDVVVEVLSIDSQQFQNAVVSVRVYVDDLNIGSPIPVPNISRLEEITTKVKEVFTTSNNSYALTTSKYRMKLESIKRERKEGLHQHCVNCMFNFLICNF